MEDIPHFKKIVIYIRLLDEGVPVVRPTYGEILGENIFRVLPMGNYNPEDETWEFLPGTIVKCEKIKIESEEALVAVEAYK